MCLQIRNRHNEWPDVLPESLWVNSSLVSTCSCTCWPFSWVALHKEECPEQMDDLTFVGEEKALHKHCPEHSCYFSTASKEGTKSAVFRWMWSHRFTMAVLDLLANGVEIGRSWEALPRLLGCSTLGHLLWECVGADVANLFCQCYWSGQWWSIINTGRPEWNTYLFWLDVQYGMSVCKWTNNGDRCV